MLVPVYANVYLDIIMKKQRILASSVTATVQLARPQVFLIASPAQSDSTFSMIVTSAYHYAHQDTPLVAKNAQVVQLRSASYLIS